MRETIELDEDVFIGLAKLAHERDITLNEMINIALREMIAVYESEDEEFRTDSCCGDCCSDIKNYAGYTEFRTDSCCQNCDCGAECDDCDCETQSEESKNEEVVEELKGSVKDIFAYGVTNDTLANFGYAFDAWNNTYVGDLTVDKILENATQEFDKEHYLA